MAAKDKGYRHGTPLGEFSIAPPCFFLPFHPKTIKPVFAFIKTVIAEFFWIQWAVKLGLRNIPVVPVDHPLDSKVPFRPELARVYLDFTNFWIRPFTLMFAHVGVLRTIGYCADFLSRIANAYHQAARVYTYRMTTTYRPPTTDRVVKHIIRAADPHYLCVPSLHIAVVALTYSFYRNVFKQEKARIPREKAEEYNHALYTGAVEIAETVLYVKQHSVNCIPAALCMLHNIASDVFSIADATGFIDSLFEDAPDVSAADKREITAHIHYMFERFLLEGLYESDWTVPVKRWIESRDGSTR
ncbi:MAG: hypothetical protein Pg6C_01040 [Treponemataceae bacterium]|nr:MAG: hypothetical protein Pg6C_01040 [Treponemataceae bacterium]